MTDVGVRIDSASRAVDRHLAREQRTTSSHNNLHCNQHHVIVLGCDNTSSSTNYSDAQISLRTSPKIKFSSSTKNENLPHVPVHLRALFDCRRQLHRCYASTHTRTRSYQFSPPKNSGASRASYMPIQATQHKHKYSIQHPERKENNSTLPLMPSGSASSCAPKRLAIDVASSRVVWHHRICSCCFVVLCRNTE